MTIRYVLRLVPVLSVALVAAVFTGCAKDKGVGPPPALQNPETELTYAPLQGDTAGFRVHLFWNGYDRDGEVTEFHYAIDSDTMETDHSKWKSTTSKDTTLLLLVDPVKEIRGHVFWVAAEDNDGRMDLTPAKRFFSTKTIPPFSNILRGPAAFNSVIGPNFTFEWEGIDPDGGETGGRAPCDSFEYLLLMIGAINDKNSPPTHQPLPPFAQDLYVDLINASVGDTLADARWGDWHWIGIHANRLRVRNATAGGYVFALRAVDLAGAREKNLSFVRNIRHFSVSTVNPGPILIVSASVLTTPLPAAVGPVDFPRREIQIFEGEVISFSWIATAEAYGGSIVGYTFALDDTASFPALDLRNLGVTYRPQDIGIGLHYLFVRVFDDGGLVTNAVIPFRIIHPTFKDPPSASNPPQYLYVDDSLSPGSLQARFFNYPSDAEDDEWWRVNVLTPLSLQYGMGRRDWDTFNHGMTDGGGSRVQPLPTDLAPYRVVVWNVDFNNQVGNPTALFQTLVGGAYSELGGYLRAGGTLLLSGFSIATNVVTPTNALTLNFSRGLCFAYPPRTIGYNQTFFPRSMMGIDGAKPTMDALRSLGAKDFLEARVTPQGSALGYVSAEVDTGVTAKWNGKAFPGDPNVSWSPGLPRIEGWKMAALFNCEPSQGLLRREDASRPISTPLFTYHGAPVGIYMTGAQSPQENLVVGVQAQAHDVGGFGGGIINPSNTAGVIGRVVVFGFPMNFIKDAQATSLMMTAFGYLNASPTLPAVP